MGLAIRPDQAVRADEHGRVADAFAVTFQQATHGVDPEARARGGERLVDGPGISSARQRLPRVSNT